MHTMLSYVLNKKGYKDKQKINNKQLFMKKILFFATIIAMAMLTSCGAPTSPRQITANPNPMTVVGGKINVEITGTFPKKSFAKKGVLVVTPVLKYAGKEVLGTPVTYIGERVKENGKTVNYKLGGTFSQSVSFDFVPEMAQAELWLRYEARKGNKPYTLSVPEEKVADGVNYTAMLVDPQEVKAQVTPTSSNASSKRCKRLTFCSLSNSLTSVAHSCQLRR